jgi:hypothetical protein
MLVQDTCVTSNFDVFDFASKLLVGTLVPPSLFSSKRRLYKTHFEALEAVLFETVKAKYLLFSITSQDAALWQQPCQTDSLIRILQVLQSHAQLQLQLSPQSQQKIDKCHLGIALDLPVAVIVKISDQFAQDECILAFTLQLTSLELIPSLKELLLNAGTLPT